MKSVTRQFRSKPNFYLGLVGLSAVLLTWEIVSESGVVNPIFISSPSKILPEALEMIDKGNIYPHLVVSLEEFFLGLILAIFFGIIFGWLIGQYKKLDAFFSPLIYSLYSTPNIALLPLIIIWVGLGLWSKVLIVFLGAFFPILINTISGVKNLDQNFVTLGKSFGATDFDIFRTITLPASIPYIMAGIRMGISRGMIGMIVGEFYVSSHGLGYLITFYGATFQTAKLFSVILIVILVSVSLTATVSYFEKRFQTWKPQKD
ncbi:MAG: ABC transporter permease [Patescibacteria group bacterium]|nr:ABC transporter permease [Patescibacteria group bacterium]